MIQKKEFQEADRAVFQEGYTTVVLQVPENERPLLKLGSLMDWRFGGVISNFLETERITGEEGECVWIPVQKNTQKIHLVLLGMGKAKTPGFRKPPGANSGRILRENLHTLGVKKIFASLSDLGVTRPQDVKDLFDGLELRLGS